MPQFVANSHWVVGSLITFKLLAHHVTNGVINNLRESNICRICIFCQAGELYFSMVAFSFALVLNELVSVYLILYPFQVYFIAMAAIL